MPLNIKDLKIESPDFAPLGKMKDEFAGDKGNVIPRLKISGVPKETVELALICHDPDAPLAHGFTHWTLYGIPPSATDLTDAEAPRRPEWCRSAWILWAAASGWAWSSPLLFLDLCAEYERGRHAHARAIPRSLQGQHHRTEPCRWHVRKLMVPPSGMLKAGWPICHSSR